MTQEHRNSSSQTAFLPFTRPEEEQREPFNSILVRRYIKPAIRWLLGQNISDGDQIIETDSNNTAVIMSQCWWGLGLCVEAFLNAQAMEGFTSDERVILAHRSIDFANRLLRAQSRIDSSWDKVTWDTSVIARSLLGLAREIRDHRFPIPDSKRLVGSIEDSVRNALNWLVPQSLNRDNVRYAFGPEDIAQVLRLLCSVAKYDRSLYPSGFANRGASTVDDLITQLANYLIELRTMPQGEGVHAEINYIPWKPPFSAAHALLAFADALPLVPSDIQGKLLNALSLTLLEAEQSQEGGRWGMPSETTFMLQGYLAAGEALLQFDHTLALKPEVIFRSIRWLTDEKQRFSDGSIMHITDYTFSYVIALQTVVMNASDNPYLRYTVPELYDFVLWREQMWSYQERAERLRVLERYHSKHQLHLQAGRLINIYVSILQVVGSAIIVLLFLGVSLLTGWDNQFITSPSFTVAYGTAAVSTVSLFLILTKRLRHRVEDA